MQLLNKVFAHTGFANLLILFLGGIVASIYQILRKDAHSPFPSW